MRFAAAIAAVAALFAVSVLGAAQMLGATDDPALPASDPVIPAGWKEHVNRRGGFAIAVHSEWRRVGPSELREMLPALTRGKRGMARAREGLLLHDLSARSRRVARRSHFVTNATVERAPAVFSRERMWKRAIEEVRRVRGSVRSRRVRLPAGEALRLDFAMPSRRGGERMAVREFLLVEGGLQYVLTFSTARHAFRGYRATFEQSARTFRLLRADSDAAEPPPSPSASASRSPGSRQAKR